MRTLILVLLFSLTIDAQCIEGGWRAITPLVTDRSTVEGLIGPPKKSGVDYPIYETPEALVQLTYTSLPCREDALGRGYYKVPESRVLRYSLRFKKAVSLDELNLTRSKYERKESGDVHNLRDYYNADDGITVTVSVQEGKEYVSVIRFSPSRKHAALFKCE